MKRKSLIEGFVNLLVEKGGFKKGDKIKFYTPELEIVDQNGVCYEVSEIDKSDDNPENWIFTIFRYDVDGSRKYELNQTAKEILKKYKNS
jgi:hypothetical protein